MRVQKLILRLLVRMDVEMDVSPYNGILSVAVLAFRLAYALEMKRRDDDRKILAPFAEMSDTIIKLDLT
jgi:hypothetical protein